MSPLKIVVLVLLVTGLPTLVYFASLHGQVQSVTVKVAIGKAEGLTEESQQVKVQIDGTVFADAERPAQANGTSASFWIKDAEGTIFKIDYSGKDEIQSLNHGQQVAVLGHPHGDVASGYFHCSQVILK